MVDFTEIIKSTIRQTAERLKNDQIVTVEEMIPLMDDSKYDNKITDIPYGTRTDDERLDIFYPETGEGPFPVFVEVHGGGFYFGQKKSVEFEPFLAGREKGFACVSLGYTLSPKAHFPLAVEEIKSAIRFLRKNAEKYHLDPDKIVLWGGSAGAYLAGLAANSCDTGYLEKDLSGNDEISAKPNVLLLWYGCYDNTVGDKNWIYQNFFGVDDLSSIKDIMDRANPIENITEKACPTMIQHGLADEVVSYKQSERYYRKLLEAGLKNQSRLELVPECDHADAYLFSYENVMKNFEFAEKYL